MESVDQAFDAIGTLQHLHGRADVVSEKFGVMGCSIGGSKMLSALNRIGVHYLNREKFRYGVAFHPYYLNGLGPFIKFPLILIGGRADSMTPRRCVTLLHRNANAAHPLDMRIYPEANHFFDDLDIGPPHYYATVQNRAISPTLGSDLGL